MRKTRAIITSREAEQLAGADLCRELNALDRRVGIGEEPYELECGVKHCGKRASILFFGWLMHRGLLDGAEVLAMMVQFFFENVYLIEGRRRRTLSNVTKPELKEFLCLVDFAVDKKEWDAHLNPFDGLLLFYNFLEEIGYPANLARRERAIREIRKTMVKQPCAAKQAGFDLVQ